MATRFRKTRKNTRRASRKALRLAKKYKRTMKRGGGILEALGLKKPSPLTGGPTNGKANNNFQYNMPKKLIEDPTMQMKSTLLKFEKYGRNLEKEEQFRRLSEVQKKALEAGNKKSFVEADKQLNTLWGLNIRKNENIEKNFNNARQRLLSNASSVTMRPSNVSTIASDPRAMNSNTSRPSSPFGGTRKNRK